MQLRLVSVADAVRSAMQVEQGRQASGCRPTAASNWQLSFFETGVLVGLGLGLLYSYMRLVLERRNAALRCL